jgi:hypothetical protein
VQEESDKTLASKVAQAAATQLKAAVKKQEEADKNLAAAAAVGAEKHEKASLRKQEEAAKKAASGPAKAEQAQKMASKKAEEGFKAELALAKSDVENTKIAGERAMKAAVKEANQKTTREHTKKTADRNRECEKMLSAARAALPSSAESAKAGLIKKIGVLQDAVKGMEGELRRCQPDMII